MVPGRRFEMSPIEEGSEGASSAQLPLKSPQFELPRL